MREIIWWIGMLASSIALLLDATLLVRVRGWSLLRVVTNIAVLAVLWTLRP